MFTGIVEKKARVRRIERRSPGALLLLENPWTVPPEAGESVSVDGACLTVVSANEREISFDVSEETLKKTTLAQAGPSSLVNLEKALKVGDDISGHFVSGHVDATGEVLSLTRQGAFATLAVRVPPELCVYLAPKGSVSVNGVSLTIASLAGDTFDVAVIPETLARTNLAALKPGDRVNVETDMLAKYVVKYLSSFGKSPTGASGLSMKRLHEAGF